MPSETQKEVEDFMRANLGSEGPDKLWDLMAEWGIDDVEDLPEYEKKQFRDAILNQPLKGVVSFTKKRMLRSQLNNIMDLSLNL